jgi:hypothetical protein
MTMKVAHPLINGDTINYSNALWESSSMTLSGSWSTSGTFISVNSWVSTDDEYIGVRYINGLDTLYGWIQIYCPSGNGLYIKDYSFGTTPIGIDEIAELNFKIIPNPADQFINIDNKFIHIGTRLQILDAMGRLIRTEMLNGKRQDVSIADLKDGVYLVQLQSKDICMTRKIIIYHK